jgi:hypothetical protein
VSENFDGRKFEEIEKDVDVLDHAVVLTTTITTLPLLLTKKPTTKVLEL